MSKAATTQAEANGSGQMGKAIVPLLLGWLLPGAGHIYLGRRYRGALLGGAALITFLFGIMMRGAFFEGQGGDLLTTLIYYGGSFANKLAGLPYYLAVWLGYDQPDVAGHVHDYGTKFLVGAGLMNLLSLVDAYEIAVGEKE